MSELDGGVFDKSSINSISFLHVNIRSYSKHFGAFMVILRKVECKTLNNFNVHFAREGGYLYNGVGAPWFLF